jgi:formylglycine-generating enzyme required for sulfatase activity
LGADVAYQEEGHAHHLTVDAFWIDCHDVTSADFSKFVSATQPGLPVARQVIKGGSYLCAPN